MSKLEELRKKLNEINEQMRSLSKDADKVREEIRMESDPELNSYLGKYLQVGNVNEYFYIIKVEKAERDRYSEDREIILHGKGLSIAMYGGKLRSVSDCKDITLYTTEEYSGLKKSIVELTEKEFKETIISCLDLYKEVLIESCCNEND